MDTGWIHLTARLSSAMPVLTEPDTGTWLWTHLQAAFPDAIAAVLMPDHPHVVVLSDDAERDRLRLARMLGQFGRCFGVRGRAAEVPSPEPIRTGTVLARQVRYVALNPCRRALVRCPLAWTWSTHRDVIGATAQPWVTAARLARVLGSKVANFAAHHHAYVSSDPHAQIAGTPMPIAAAPTLLPTVGLGTIATASAAALRMPSTLVRRASPVRALFVALAIDQGWKQVTRLAEVCDCSRQTIRRIAAQRDASGLHAARMCLGDARLNHSLGRDDPRRAIRAA